MSRNEDYYEDDDDGGGGYENNYKEHQERYKSLRKEWEDDSNDWSDERKHDHLENMKNANDEEVRGREEAAEEWGDDGDEGHEQRIDKLKGTSQLLVHDMAHVNGEYEYQTGGMRDMDEDLRRELENENNERWGYNHAVEGGHVEEREGEPEDENSDMDIQSDSDSDSD